VNPRAVGAVAAGGALGALARHLLASAWPHPAGGFPWSTLVVNLTGCLLIGALLATAYAHRPLVRAFLATGVLGGYTTFSTYAVETRDLVAAGRPGLAAVYALSTLAGALAAVALGAAAVRR
jgi:fluoride exporter